MSQKPLLRLDSGYLIQNQSQSIFYQCVEKLQKKVKPPNVQPKYQKGAGIANTFATLTF